jgi:hypothetical protein
MSTPLNQVTVSDTNLTPIIQIVTWFCLATSLLAFLTHVGIRLYLFRALKIESWLVLLALVRSTGWRFPGTAYDNFYQVFCVVQSIAVLLQTGHGLGKPLHLLSNSDIQSNLKVRLFLAEQGSFS